MRKAFQGKDSQTKQKDLSLGVALQGGGSYGAFTKGALIALLEDGIITANNLTAVTGTSAGAKNGALLVDGLTSGTAKSTLEKLDNYWNDIGKTWANNTKTPFPFINLFLPTPVSSRSYPNLTEAFKRAAASMSPPHGYMLNMLKKHLKKHITSWTALKTSPIKLFINAVKENPKTGAREHHVFTGNKLSANTVPLSANLHEFGAAEYRNDHYYDGAYWRNPCFDGVLAEKITDLMVISIQKTPERAIEAQSQDDARIQMGKPGYEIIGEEIHDHMAWLSQNNPKLNLHEIKLDVPPEWDDSSRMNADPIWLEQLSEMGYNAAKQWINENKHLLGTASSYKTQNNVANDNQNKIGNKRRAPV